MKIANKIFIVIVALTFVLLTAVFNFLPRSTFSETEKRELAEFPTLSLERLLSGRLTEEISAWYSDTEPYRDEFMTLSMHISDKLALRLESADGPSIAFHAAEPADDADGTQDLQQSEPIVPDSITPYVNTQNPAEENAKMANAGILVVGTAPHARALMAFGASPKASERFASLVNRFQTELGPQVQVYCMAIPNSIEFYCPDKAKNVTKSQSAVINHLYANLDGAKGVDCYTPLGEHVHEDIFLRTDHHWAPLGAYYAAQAFAKTANVPFLDISEYDSHVIHNFVGTMYGYSKDIAIKQSPEDFVYYTPRDLQYTTTYTVYNLDKDMRVISEQKPHQGQFFAKFRDGSPMAYLTFMGGDYKITHVKTQAGNGRRLAILKDSFGNALPGYLFGSFEEIHVIDYRYFTKNIKEYVNEHGITDLLFAHSIFMLLGDKPIRHYNSFLSQGQSTKSTPKSVPAPVAVSTPAQIATDTIPPAEESSDDETKMPV